MDKSIALVFSVIMIFTACQQDRSGWKGTIQVVDGVQTVKNPQEPIYSGEVLELEEDLSIGASKGGDEYIFSRIGNLDVDSNGNIYAIDTSSAHIRVFDSNGQYLRAIGRKGQGPGEMQMPGFVQATSQHAASNSASLTAFPPSWTYPSTIEIGCGYGHMSESRGKKISIILIYSIQRENIWPRRRSG